MARVQASDAMLYTIGFGGGAEVPQLKQQPRELRAIHRRPRVLPAPDAASSTASSTQIVAELANQYVLSYASTNAKQDNTWRNIKVQVRKGKYDIRARRGYRAPGPQRAER